MACYMVTFNLTFHLMTECKQTRGRKCNIVTALRTKMTVLWTKIIMHGKLGKRK
jgi:hypothetical protein